MVRNNYVCERPVQSAGIEMGFQPICNLCVNCEKLDNKTTVHKGVLPSATNCEGNVFTPVCHSVHRVGDSASVHAGIPPPGGRPPQSRHPPPRPGTPQIRHPSRSRPPRDWAPLPQQTATVADGTHPTGMHSCNQLSIV